jgi:Fibronectin type III domain
MPSMGRNPTSPSPAQFRMQTALLVGLLMSLILNDCATPSRETQVSADSVEQIRLSWEAPTTRTDGTPLTDIAGFTLYYGLASGEYAFLKALGSQTTAAVSGLEPGETYYFAVTAFDHAGNESRFSNEATVTAPLSVGRTPMLTQDPLRRGQTSHFRVRGAEPNEVVSFLFGTTGEGEGPCSPQLSGLCVDLLEPRVFGEATADSTGAAIFTHIIPADAPLGQTVSIQAVIQRGSGGTASIKSNTITARVLAP